LQLNELASSYSCCISYLIAAKWKERVKGVGDKNQENLEQGKQSNSVIKIIKIEIALISLKGGIIIVQYIFQIRRILVYLLRACVSI
jgi:hypothetical protein